MDPRRAEFQTESQESRSRLYDMLREPVKRNVSFSGDSADNNEKSLESKKKPLVVVASDMYREVLVVTLTLFSDNGTFVEASRLNLVPSGIREFVPSYHEHGLHVQIKPPRFLADYCSAFSSRNLWQHSQRSATKEMCQKIKLGFHSVRHFLGFHRN